MTDIHLTQQQTLSDGSLEVEGDLLRFKGWTFSAVVDSGFDNGCWACGHGRIVEVTLFHDGEMYYTCPGSDLDNHMIALDDMHYAMFDQIDRLFPPSPEEREQLREQQERAIEEVAESVMDLVYSSPLRGTPDRVLKRVFRKLARDIPARSICD